MKKRKQKRIKRINKINMMKMIKVIEKSWISNPKDIGNGQVNRSFSIFRDKAEWNWGRWVTYCQPWVKMKWPEWLFHFRGHIHISHDPLSLLIWALSYLPWWRLFPLVTWNHQPIGVEDKRKEREREREKMKKMKIKMIVVLNTIKIAEIRWWR